MKESAMIALEYIRSHAEVMGLDPEKIGKTNVHLHVPQGAIPKDGPSAGITMVSAMVSAFTGKKIRKALAMTGEITLRGQVLPVGGIKEKILAAKRAGIKEIIMCDRNKQDVEEIDDRYIKGLSFTYVSNILEVVQRAVTKEKAN
jgi:ATP-dependent Lon protease